MFEETQHLEDRGATRVDSLADVVAGVLPGGPADVQHAVPLNRRDGVSVVRLVRFFCSPEHVGLGSAAHLAVSKQC